MKQASSFFSHLMLNASALPKTSSTFSSGVWSLVRRNWLTASLSIVESVGDGTAAEMDAGSPHSVQACGLSGAKHRTQAVEVTKRQSSTGAPRAGTPERSEKKRLMFAVGPRRLPRRFLWPGQRRHRERIPSASSVGSGCGGEVKYLSVSRSSQDAATDSSAACVRCTWTKTTEHGIKGWACARGYCARELVPLCLRVFHREPRSVDLLAALR